MSLSATERIEFAAAFGVNEQYLYQCLTGRRDMGVGKAVQVERASRNRIRRWNLRLDWFLQWPELIGATGAPSLASAKKRLAERDAAARSEQHAEA